MSKESLAKQEQGEPVAIVEKVIKNLEPLLDAKNQSWAKAKKMLLSILENQSEQPKQEQRSDSEHTGEPVAWESVLGAVARGWCYEENANKTMDSELAVAIAKEVHALYTTPQPKQEQGEPVASAWMYQGEMVNAFPWPPNDPRGCDSDKYWEGKGYTSEPLYTTPQQRTWVGLTDEDYQVLREGVVKQGKPLHWMIKHIDAKLKEKNT